MSEVKLKPVIATGFGASVSPMLFGYGVPVSVGASAGSVTSGTQTLGYVDFSAGIVFSQLPADVYFEAIILNAGKTIDDLSGASVSISFSPGATAGLIFNTQGEQIGVLGGLKTDLETNVFSLNYTFVFQKVKDGTGLWEAEGWSRASYLKHPEMKAERRLAA